MSLVYNPFNEKAFGGDGRFECALKTFDRPLLRLLGSERSVPGFRET